MLTLDNNMLSKRLIIFEGPDGAGKTTLARQVAQDIGAMYVHLGPFPRVGGTLSRFYIDAMMPAILGHRDVVMDRCWISEHPYALAFRDGGDRVGIRRRVLERLAWRCKTTVVRCIPPFEDVRQNFMKRHTIEYLDNVDQLQKVHSWYQDNEGSTLPSVRLNPLELDVKEASYCIQDAIATHATDPHATAIHTAGNLHAPILLVGEGFGETAPEDPLYQSPFGSISESGCSLWLARHLEDAGIGEHELAWINAPEIPEGMFPYDHAGRIIALGVGAAMTLNRLGSTGHVTVAHPQHHKRFHVHEPYDLAPTIRRIQAELKGTPNADA